MRRVDKYFAVPAAGKKTKFILSPSCGINIHSSTFPSGIFHLSFFASFSSLYILSVRSSVVMSSPLPIFIFPISFARLPSSSLQLCFSSSHLPLPPSLFTSSSLLYTFALPFHIFLPLYVMYIALSSLHNSFPSLHLLLFLLL
jgi:hypothetical protein